MSFYLDTPTISGRVLARALGATACGLAALLCFESAASAQPPKLRRLQQLQQQRQAQQPAPAPAAEPAPAPPAAEPPPAPVAAEPAPLPPAVQPPPAPPAAEPPPAPLGAEAPPAPPTAGFAPIAAEPAAPAPLAAEAAPAPRVAEPPPAPLAAEPAPAMLSAPPDSTADRADAAASAGSDSEKPRQFGAMFDLGVPDGTMLSFVYRPVEMARFHAGAGYNGISPGLRLGGVFLPFGWGPALEIDYGHYFEGDANGVAGLFGDTGDGSVVLESIGYDYVNFRAGMDFGGERFTFFAHGGISWLRTTIHEFDTLLGPGDAQSNTSIEIRKDPVLNAWVPNLQLGFIVHL